MRLVLLAFSFVLLASCNRTAQDQNSDFDYSLYIQGHTSGLVSSRSSIEVFFANPVPGFSEVAIEQLVHVEPEIPGHWSFMDSQLLRFTPSKPMPAGEKITISLALSKLIQDAQDVPDFHFDFHVMDQTLRLGEVTLMALGENQNVWNQVELEVISADILDAQTSNQVMTAYYQGNLIPLRWQIGNDGLLHKAIIDSVRRGELRDSINIMWKLGENSGNTFIQVPSIYDFKVLSVQVESDPVQRFAINFSDPLAPDQNLMGLVQLNGQTELRTNIRGNLLEVYPLTELSGTVSISIASDIQNISGGRLKDPWSNNYEFEDYSPEVRFLKSGSVVPVSGKMAIPIEFINLSAIDVQVVKIYHNNLGSYFQNSFDGNDSRLKYVGRPVLQKSIKLPAASLNKWQTISLDLTEISGSDPSSMYSVRLSFKPSYSRFVCPTPLTDPEYPSESWDSQGYDYVYNWNIDGFSWDQKDNPCHVSYFNFDRFPARTFLFSNVALLVRELSHGKYLAVVTNLHTGKPESEAEVVFYNLQNQVIGKVKTNADGIAQWTAKSSPYRVEARKGKNSAFLTLDKGGALSMANFDTDGVSGEQGVKAFIYGERGVWRPGDTIFANVIVQNLDGNLAKGVPLIFEWRDPDGNVVKRWVRPFQGSSMVSERIITSSDQRTGNYSLVVKIGGAEFRKRFPLEFIKPNKLKAELQFPSVRIVNQLDAIQLESKWLTGLPAANLKVTIDAKPKRFGEPFSNAKGFTFSDPFKPFNEDQVEYVNATLNGQGTLEVKNKIKDFNANGPVMVDYVTRIFEPGGDFSIQLDQAIVFSHSTMVGFKEPALRTEGLGWLESGKSYPMPIILRDAYGKAVSGKVKVEFYKVSWSWWWSSDDQRTAQYQNKVFQNKLSEEVLQVNQGKAQWNARVDSDDWGRYFVRFTDMKSGHSSGGFLYFDWGLDRTRMDRDAQESPAFLSIQAQKNSYKIGEEAQIIIPTTGTGKILVFLDKGSGSIGHFWVDSKPGMTRLSIPIQSEMAPTLYVYAMEIQPHSNTKNNMPMRMYGVIPIEVFEEKTKLFPVVRAPEKIAPNAPFTIAVSEKNGGPMEYTLAVVDEGLLGITRFKTPDPWAHFYGKESYSVRTWDMYEQVMGAFGGSIDQHLALGGDEDLRGGGADNGMRFKPVVSFIGPFYLKPGQLAKHALHMPNYAGAVRVMVVAAERDAFGFAEKEVMVTQPLMAMISAPRQFGIGEEVDVPVNVFVLDDQVRGAVQVHFEAGGTQTKTIQTKGKGSYHTSFRIKVPQQPGKLDLKATVRSGSTTTADHLTIQVIHQVPHFLQFHTKWVEPGQTVSLAGPHLENLVWWKAGLSTLPGLNPQGLSTFLMDYPYGCSEQLLSRTITMGLAAELYNSKKSEVAGVISKVNQTLFARQTGSGGILLWDTGPVADPWATSMLGLHIMAARQIGVDFPESRFQTWKAFQVKMARGWSPNNGTPNSSQVDQAFRLFSLAFVGQPDIGAMNRMQAMNNLSRSASILLAAAYAKAGQRAMGLKLLSQSKQVTGQTYGRYDNANCYVYMEAYCLALFDKKEQAFEIIQSTAGSGLDMSQMTTQEAMWALLASQQLIGNAKVADIKATWKANGKELSQQKGKFWTEPRVKGGKVFIEAKNLGESPMTLQVVSAKRPVPGQEKARQEGVSLRSQWSNANGLVNLKSVAQGEQLKLKVEVRQLVYGTLNDLALEIPIPSGFEVQNPNLLDNTTFGNGVQHVEVRDEKVIVFFDALSNQAMKFELSLTATFAGRYYAGPIQVRAMYRPAIAALIEGQWIEVVSGQP